MIPKWAMVMEWVRVMDHAVNQSFRKATRPEMGFFLRRGRLRPSPFIFDPSAAHHLCFLKKAGQAG